MKKLLLLSISIAMIATVAVAQDQKQEQKSTTEVKPAVQEQKPQEAKDPKVERAEWEKKLKAELKLTDEQSAKFDALSKEYSDKMDAVLQDASLDKNAQKEKKMALKKEKEEKLLQFLTPEQQATYKAIIEKKKKEMEAPKQSS